MIIGIDTSERRRTVVVAVDDAGKVVHSAVQREGSVVASLAQEINTMLAAGDTVQAVVAAVGPGSYTGVRTGLAAALGVAQSLGVPLHGIGSLEVVAHGAPPGATAIRACADAGRGGCYVADFVRDADGTVRPRGPARRVALGDINDGDALPVSSSPLEGCRTIDPTGALAGSIPSALATEPLDHTTLSATQIGTVSFARIPGNARV